MSFEAQTMAERKPSFTSTGFLQRKCDKCKERSFYGESSTEQAEPMSMPPIVNEVISSPGQPLDEKTRAFMESRFAHDFSRVRIHTDNRAAESARAVNALAYTVGKHVVFGKNHYLPDEIKGRRFLAHELTHVIQQESAINTNFKRHLTAESAMEREAEEIAFHYSDNGKFFPSIHASNIQILRVDTPSCIYFESDQIRNDASAAVPAIHSTMAQIIANPKSPSARIALFIYFGTSAQPWAIWRRLKVIADNLLGSTIECLHWPFEFFYWRCGCSDPRNVACVHGIAPYLGFGNIKLCQPTYYGKDYCYRISTLVHEGSHRYNRTSDNAYYNDDCSENADTLALKDNDRYDNADSYGCLVQTLGCRPQPPGTQPSCSANQDIAVGTQIEKQARMSLDNDSIGSTPEKPIFNVNCPPGQLCVAGNCQPPEVLPKEKIEMQFNKDAPQWWYDPASSFKVSLTPGGRAAFEELVAKMERQPTLRVQLEGHASSDRPANDEGYNRRLTDRRVRLIASELEKRGIPRSRIGSPADESSPSGCEEIDKESRRGLISCGDEGAKVPADPSDRKVAASLFQ
jgi:outer membrane protein OmpA-like peptidoglycan-associated protein